MMPEQMRTVFTQALMVGERGYERWRNHMVLTSESDVMLLLVPELRRFNWGFVSPQS